MANNLVKFYKVASLPATLVPGAIYFVTTTQSIHVATATDKSDVFGMGLKGATLENSVLTITRHDDTKVTVDFSDIASASSVVNALALKADKTQVAEDIAAAQAADKAAWEAYADQAEADAIAAAKVKDVDTTAANGVNLSVDADGKLDVTVTPGSIAAGNTSVVTGDAVFTAINNVERAAIDAVVGTTDDEATYITVYGTRKYVDEKVDAVKIGGSSDNTDLINVAFDSNTTFDILVTEKLANAVTLAESALQKEDIVTGSANGTISVEGADVAVKGLGSAAYTEASAYDIAGAANAVNDRLTQTIGTLDSTDAKTLEAINDELNSVDGELSNIKSAIAGGVHFAGVFSSLPSLETEDGRIWADIDGSIKEFKIGDIIIIPDTTHAGESELLEPTKEYILAEGVDSQVMWVELGDINPANERLTTIEASYVKSVVTTDGEYVKLTPDSEANNEVIVAVDDSAIKNKFAAVDAYTVNGQAISTNPVLNGSDILITGYTEQTASTLAATDSINVALGKLEARVDAAAAGGVQSVGGKASSITLDVDADGEGNVKFAISDSGEISATVNIGATAAQGAKADTAVQTVVSGSANGTIAVDGTDVAVTGLGSAAFTEASAYDAAGAAETAEANAKAYADVAATGIFKVIEDNEKVTANALTDLDTRLQDVENKKGSIESALQASDITTGSANGTISVKGSDIQVKGLGSAAYTEASDYATAAQGAKADTAYQKPAAGIPLTDLASSVYTQEEVDAMWAWVEF